MGREDLWIAEDNSAAPPQSDSITSPPSLRNISLMRFCLHSLGMLVSAKKKKKTQTDSCLLTPNQVNTISLTPSDFLPIMLPKTPLNSKSQSISVCFHSAAEQLLSPSRSLFLHSQLICTLP